VCIFDLLEIQRLRDVHAACSLPHSTRAHVTRAATEANAPKQQWSFAGSAEGQIRCLMIHVSHFASLQDAPVRMLAAWRVPAGRMGMRVIWAENGAARAELDVCVPT
jgi:hypothetical protein